jgi:hypothetical protein
VLPSVREDHLWLIVAPARSNDETSKQAVSLR